MQVQIKADVKWFAFHQNNSGGRFVRDDNVCEYVLIQARNADEAIRKAEEFCDNSDSCPCCGDRWSFWIRDEDGTDEPMIYDELISVMKKGSYRELVKLHHFDGRVETINLPE